MKAHKISIASCAREQIFVLDNDLVVRKVVSGALTPAGYEIVSFSDRSGLLAAALRQAPVCILLDVHTPLQSGLQVLRELREQNYCGPIMMMSGCSDIATAVSAIRLDATDFIEKPLNGSEIADRISAAIDVSRRSQAEAAQAFKLTPFPGCELLSDRELDVLELLVRGANSKESGLVLGISPRTVEDHRAHIIKKLGVRRGTDIVRMVMGAVRA
jgi:FixJ family two-component response regulator